MPLVTIHPNHSMMQSQAFVQEGDELISDASLRTEATVVKVSSPITKIVFDDASKLIETVRFITSLFDCESINYR